MCITKARESDGKRGKKGNGNEKKKDASLEREIHSLNKARTASNAGTVGGETVRNTARTVVVTTERRWGRGHGGRQRRLPICQHKIRQKSWLSFTHTPQTQALTHTHTHNTEISHTHIHRDAHTHTQTAPTHAHQIWKGKKINPKKRKKQQNKKLNTQKKCRYEAKKVKNVAQGKRGRQCWRGKREYEREVSGNCSWSWENLQTFA